MLQESPRQRNPSCLNFIRRTAACCERGLTPIPKSQVPANRRRREVPVSSFNGLLPAPCKKWQGPRGPSLRGPTGLACMAYGALTHTTGPLSTALRDWPARLRFARCESQPAPQPQWPRFPKPPMDWRAGIWLGPGGNGCAGTHSSSRCPGLERPRQ